MQSILKFSLYNICCFFWNSLIWKHWKNESRSDLIVSMLTYKNCLLFRNDQTPNKRPYETSKRIEWAQNQRHKNADDELICFVRISSFSSRNYMLPENHSCIGCSFLAVEKLSQDNVNIDKFIYTSLSTSSV